MQCDKTCLNKFKRIEMISSIFPQHQQYETGNQLQEEKWGKKIPNTCELNMLLKKIKGQ